MDSRKGTNYRIVLRGELSERFAPHFEGMQIESGEGLTILTGLVVDQAHMSGLLERISELGVELVSVQPVS